MENNNQITTGSKSGLEKRDANNSRLPSLRPQVDIFEGPVGITVVADLPGVSKDGLDVRVHDNNLLIEATSKPEAAENMELLHAEVRVPRFFRSFVLSSDFDSSKINARLNDGVLTVTVPRREESKPRRIEVQVQ